MVEFAFDASNITPDAGYDIVPAGWYNVILEESEMKPTKDGMGAYLNFRFDIVDGQYKGRKLFHRFNVKNANAQAQEIAFKQLSAVGHAVGVLQINNTEMLHNRPLKVKVKVKKDKEGQYEDSNEIVSFKNINEVVDSAGATPVSPFASAPAIPPKAAVIIPPSAPVLASAPSVPEYVMAPGEAFTREQYKSAGWTDEALIAQGKMTVKAPVAPAAPAPAAPAQPWGAPAAPTPAAPAPAPAAAAPAAPTAPAAPAAPATPPWARPPA
jgi:hypothetical protein